MNMQLKLLKSAIALAITASTVLVASNAFADPYDHDHGQVWVNGNHPEQARDEYYDEHHYRDHDRDDHRYPYPNTYSSNQQVRVYPGTTVYKLPDGCRKVVYHDQVYYSTRNNDVYYSYDPYRRAYVVVNLPGINIRF